MAVIEEADNGVGSLDLHWVWNIAFGDNWISSIVWRSDAQTVVSLHKAILKPKRVHIILFIYERAEQRMSWICRLGWLVCWSVAHMHQLPAHSQHIHSTCNVGSPAVGTQFGCGCIAWKPFWPQVIRIANSPLLSVCYTSIHRVIRSDEHIFDCMRLWI